MITNHFDPVFFYICSDEAAGKYLESSISKVV